MRSFVLVALLATLAVSSASARQLTQYALSNSNGCLSTIPKCEPGACATRNVMGVARWVCLRCMANYDPVVDASGQDNILQCVCPRGFYETSTDAESCTRCPENSYCPGGDKVENPASRGNTTCGDNLVTRNTGARTQSDCVAPAGYARTSPTSGAPDWIWLEVPGCLSCAVNHSSVCTHVSRTGLRGECCSCQPGNSRGVGRDVW